MTILLEFGITLSVAKSVFGHLNTMCCFGDIASASVKEAYFLV